MVPAFGLLLIFNVCLSVHCRRFLELVWSCGVFLGALIHQGGNDVRQEHEQKKGGSHNGRKPETRDDFGQGMQRNHRGGDKKAKTNAGNEAVPQQLQKAPHPDGNPDGNNANHDKKTVN